MFQIAGEKKKRTTTWIGIRVNDTYKTANFVHLGYKY